MKSLCVREGCYANIINCESPKTLHTWRQP